MNDTTSTFDSPSLHASPLLSSMAQLVANHPDFWVRMGNMETRLVASQIEKTTIQKPVYVCGLARSGSTILLEMLAAQPGVVTHRYQDFPFVFTPYWWNTLLKCVPLRDKKMRERAHGDRILVNTESPEAMEEMLWTAFFSYLHEDDRSEVLDLFTRNVAFEQFYTDHIRKLLRVRGGTRYVAKGNYNITRMGYLHHLFPDARFIIPIRDPVSHIVSLMRQHERFSAAGRNNPRVTAQMSASGHFEFGLSRLSIHTGDAPRRDQIERAWEKGEEVLGWALYWDMIYRFTYNQLMQNRTLARQVLVVPYEELCDKPRDVLHNVFRHADLPVEENSLNAMAAAIKAPDYYESPLSDSDLDLIYTITADTANLFGYEAA